MEDHCLTGQAELDFRIGLSKYAMVCSCLAGFAAQIIATGRRSGFNVSNLDDLQSSAYVMPRRSAEDGPK